jgi:hypothetical protein
MGQHNQFLFARKGGALAIGRLRELNFLLAEEEFHLDP